MKLQNLTLIFIIIILPIVLVLSFYISSTIKTVKFQAAYDEALLTAAHDAVYAFEVNSGSEDLAKNPEIKRSLIKSSVEMFETSLANSYGISNYSSDEIEDYIPAVLFGMQDGFYLYAPSAIYETPPTAMEYEHNLKNYVYYSEIIEGAGADGSDITVIYSLDNYITACGVFDTSVGYEIISGYLIVLDGTANDGTQYRGIPIIKETINGEENAVGQAYYRESYQITNKIMQRLRNIVIDGVKPFDISPSNDPEDETSIYVQHKRKKIRNKIEEVLTSTITAYSKKVFSKNFKMPNIKEEEWEKIYNNISMIGFFQGKEMGLTEYNGYCVVNSTNSKEYVSPNLMYFIDSAGKYHDIRCTQISGNVTGYRIGRYEYKIEDTEVVTTDPITGAVTTETKPQPKYENDALACYQCINTSLNSSVSVYDYVKPGSASDNAIKTSYWTSLARERYEQNETTPSSSKVKIIFDPNHGTEEPSEFLSGYSAPNKIYTAGDIITFPDAEYDAANPSKPYLKRDGYIFKGWNTSPTDTIGMDTTGVIASWNTTYYAIWEAKECDVTFVWNFDINGDGNVNDSDREINKQKYDKRVDFLQTYSGARTGYNFDGWCKTDGGTPLTDAEKMDCKVKLNPDDNIYYAKWSAINYEIKFMMNDGTTDLHIDPPDVKPYGSSVDKPATDPVRTGYTFVGWSNAPTTYDETSFPFTVIGNKTIFAYWGHTITFDYNNGTGEVRQLSFMHEQTIAFPPTPVKEGHIFKGWYTVADSANQNSTTLVDAAQKVTTNATYYAGWEEEEYYIEFSYNDTAAEPATGADLSGYNKVYKYGETIVFPPEPTRQYYTFEGWSTSPISTTPDKNPVVVAKGDEKYYAIWKIEEFDVTFDLNEGSIVGNINNFNKSYPARSKPIDFPPNPTRTDYIFDCWEKDDGTRIEESDKANEEVTRSVTYKALWIPAKRTLTFDPRNGEDVWTEEHEFNSVANFRTNISLEGHKLVGWNTNPAERTGVTSARVLEDTTYYAIWEEEEYRITFYFNNDNNDSKETFQTYGHNIDVPEEEIGTKVGHKFKGWKKGITGVDILSTEEVEQEKVPAGNVDYYGQWEAQKYKVEFHYNNGTPETIESENQTFGENIRFPTTPVRVGHTFDGWSTVRDGAKLGSTPKVSANESENVFYARWIINKYDVTFNFNGGKNGAGESQKIYRDVEYGTQLASYFPTDVTYVGHDLEYWTKNGIPVDPNNEVLGDGSVTYVAKWKRKQYTIQFGRNANASDTEMYERFEVTVFHGDTIELPGDPEDPTRAGFNFVGWGWNNRNTSTAAAKARNTITSSGIYYAIWQPVPPPDANDTMQIRASVQIANFGSSRCY